MGRSPLKPNASGIIKENEKKVVYSPLSINLVDTMQEARGQVLCIYNLCHVPSSALTVPRNNESEPSNDHPSFSLNHRYRPLLLCPPRHPAHLSRPHLNNPNLRQRPRSSLRIHSHPVNSRNSHLRHQVPTRAGRNPKPACLPRRHAKIGLWWTFSSCSTTMSHWCVSFRTLSGTRSR